MFKQGICLYCTILWTVLHCLTVCMNDSDLVPPRDKEKEHVPVIRWWAVCSGQCSPRGWLKTSSTLDPGKYEFSNPLVGSLLELKLQEKAGKKVSSTVRSDMNVCLIEPQKGCSRKTKSTPKPKKCRFGEPKVRPSKWRLNIECKCFVWSNSKSGEFPLTQKIYGLAQKERCTDENAVCSTTESGEFPLVSDACGLTCGEERWPGNDAVLCTADSSSWLQSLWNYYSDDLRGECKTGSAEEREEDDAILLFMFHTDLMLRQLPLQTKPDLWFSNSQSLSGCCRMFSGFMCCI